MPFAIRIKESHEESNPWLFVKQFPTLAEYNQVANLCQTMGRIDGFSAALCVIRTDTCSHFCEDFFLPGVTEALKIQDLAARIFVVIGSFIFAVLTLPIRCLTLIPRYLWNRAHSRENHPLYKYLVEQKADPRLLNRDHVYVEKAQLTPRRNGKFDLVEDDDTLNFIDLPEHVNFRGQDYGSTKGISAADVGLVYPGHA